MKEVNVKALSKSDYVRYEALRRGPLDQPEQIEDTFERDWYNELLNDWAENNSFDKADLNYARVGDWVKPIYPDFEPEVCGRSCKAAIREWAVVWGFGPSDPDTMREARCGIDPKGELRTYNDGEFGDVIRRHDR